jgi:ferrous-iron efflux pump FieF
VSEHATLTSRAAMASIAMALFLLVLKIWAAAQTGSVAMLGSLADTALDLLASGVTLYGVRYAAMPADRDHRFGHGKAEALAALVEGHVTANAEYGIGVSIIAMAATGALLAYQRYVIRQTKSVAIHADHVHYQSDVLLNGAVIVALLLDQYAGIAWADPVFGVGIALALLWGAWRASSNAIDQLMDREWPAEKRQNFLDAAAKYPELAGLHDLRTRTSGAQDFVQFHVWVDPNLSVRAAHDAMDAVEEALEAEFPGTEILIHLDPRGNTDREGVLPTELAEEAPL